MLFSRPQRWCPWLRTILNNSLNNFCFIWLVGKVKDVRIKFFRGIATSEIVDVLYSCFFLGGRSKSDLYCTDLYRLSLCYKSWGCTVWGSETSIVFLKSNSDEYMCLIKVWPNPVVSWGTCLKKQSSGSYLFYAKQHACKFTKANLRAECILLRYLLDVFRNNASRSMPKRVFGNVFRNKQLWYSFLRKKGCMQI